MSVNDRTLIRDTWTIAKKNGNIAPKSFIQYFRLIPAAQQQFPIFADVSLADLPTNPHFLNQAYTCLAGMNAYIESLGKNPKACPYLNNPGFKSIKPDELKTYLGVLFNVMQDELGDSFTPEAQKAWQDGLNACDAAFRKSH